MCTDSPVLGTNYGTLTSAGRSQESRRRPFITAADACGGACGPRRCRTAARRAGRGPPGRPGACRGRDRRLDRNLAAERATHAPGAAARKLDGNLAAKRGAQRPSVAARNLDGTRDDAPAGAPDLAVRGLGVDTVTATGSRWVRVTPRRPELDQPRRSGAERRRNGHDRNQPRPAGAPERHLHRGATTGRSRSVGSSPIRYRPDRPSRS
jgi:hypothetical protein